MSVYACVIVGLKYVGGSDDFPSRITVGDVIELRKDPRNLHNPGSVAAYHHGKKVGYLSEEKQGVWTAITRSARHRAIVVGEITDEDGELAGLDVRIFAPAEFDHRARRSKNKFTGREPPRKPAFRTAIGISVLFLTFAAMAHADSVGPDWNSFVAGRQFSNVGDKARKSVEALRRCCTTQSLLAPETDRVVAHLSDDALAAVDKHVSMVEAELIEAQERRIKLANAMRLNPSDQIMHLSMSDGQAAGDSVLQEPPGVSKESQIAAEHYQADELKRTAEQAAAHRLAAERRQRAELAELLRQVEMQRSQQLAEELRQAQEATAQQQLQLEQLKRLTREAVAHWQAENGKLHAEIARLQQHIGEMKLSQQQLEEEKTKYLAFQELNVRELAQHRNRITAWNLFHQLAQAVMEQKSKTTQAQAPKAQKNEKVLITSPAKVSKKTPIPTVEQVRKKTNFSRYAQENQNPGQTTSR